MSAKQHPLRDQRDWYPYYAGFTEQFVAHLLSAEWHNFRNVLDPWNGSGTTTAVCTKTGLASRGIDINPALTVIARGRLVPASIKNQLQDLIREVVCAAKHSSPRPKSSDLLRLWLSDDAVLNVRCIEDAIRTMCGIRPEDNFTEQDDINVDHFSALMSFLYTALFSSVRSTLGGFRSTNPMWIKKAANSTELVRPSRSVLLQLFRTSAKRLQNLLSMPEPNYATCDMPVNTGDAANLPYADQSFDSVITSPPYATRLDYVTGTLPELAILGATERAIVNLRRRVTGSPVVHHISGHSDGQIPSEYACRLLEQVQAHPSKGSKAYYYPWLRHYLWNLKRGLDEIDRTVAKEGAICIVVQDSRYKELHIDLQQIVTELLTIRGRHLRSRIDHPAKNLRFFQVQIRETQLKTAKNVETLLVYGPTKSP